MPETLSDKKIRINNEIGRLEKELKNVRGTKTEVYSRITGYYRPIKNWNKGKREEYYQRNVFSKKKGVKKMEERFKDIIQEQGTKILFFTQPKCPNCIPMKKYLNDKKIKYKEINALDNIDLARSLQIMGTPTLVHFDDTGEILNNCKTVDDLQAISL